MSRFDSEGGHSSSGLVGGYNLGLHITCLSPSVNALGEGELTPLYKPGQHVITAPRSKRAESRRHYRTSNRRTGCAEGGLRTPFGFQARLIGGRYAKRNACRGPSVRG